MNLYKVAIANSATDVADANALLATGGIANELYNPQKFTTIQNLIQTDGLSSTTVNFLEGLGLSSSDIEQTTQNILALNPDASVGPCCQHTMEID